MTEISADIVLKNRSKLEGLIIPFASYKSFENLTDKWMLFELAERLGVPSPKTYFIQSPADITALEDEFEYPIVLKPYRSRIFENGRWISGTVRYARSKSELKEIVSYSEPFNKHSFLVQEFIRGTGQGIFALYDNGRPVTFFAHRRLREKPPTGGVSVLCESIAVDDGLREIATKILDSVKWHGIAMVEFKVSDDGTPYLMEVNARFWGSLQLAIDSGIDFPYLLYRMALGDNIACIDKYNIGIRSRWLLGDLDNLYFTISGTTGSASEYFSKAKAFMNFLNFFGKRTRYEVNQWGDLMPFIFELRNYLTGLRR